MSLKSISTGKRSIRRPRKIWFNQVLEDIMERGKGWQKSKTKDSRKTEGIGDFPSSIEPYKTEGTLEDRMRRTLNITNKE
jgi:hypothetical protein